MNETISLDEFTLQHCIQISFYGPRPNNPYMGGYDWHTSKNQYILTLIQQLIIRFATSTKYKKVDFLCDGNLGIGQMAFASSYYLRETQQYPKIGELSIAVSYENFYEKWYNTSDIERYLRHKEKADDYIIIDTLPAYQTENVPINYFHPSKIKQQIKFLVVHSNLGIVFFDGVEQNEQKYTTPMYQYIQLFRTQNKPFILVDLVDFSIKYEHNTKQKLLKIL